jgi:hypothetical protein
VARSGETRNHAVPSRDGRLCKLKGIFDGTVDAEEIDRKSLSITCGAYLKRLGTYAKGVNPFRDNFDSYWDYEVLLARGQDGLAHISPFLSYVEPMQRLSLGWIEHHLNLKNATATTLARPMEGSGAGHHLQIPRR